MRLILRVNVIGGKTMTSVDVLICKALEIDQIRCVELIVIGLESMCDELTSQ